ncbi:ribose 5-phosphate isomerase B [Streptomyces sp. HNM0575]|uniref:ribose 5-phosphate isomerase B n=1 Tax=Streptomyces sp. HNM0575 TaxID=2716338 RepID=UPI00145F48F3|nr:ribose 5-phosphate isomerase B [Streptomyces sp. HNM0575]NLU75287.1 ribose 5-phosphate isomerase B [Streptomyces sp. HNM0575]
MSTIAIGSDDAGAAMKDALRDHLIAKGHDVTDYGSGEDEDYPDVAERVAVAVADGRHDRAVLVCGTGIGVAITANKVPGVRAAQIADAYSAERARKSNDAQIACLGSRTLGIEQAKVCLDHWVASEFDGGRSLPKVRKIQEVEQRQLAAHEAKKFA